MGLLLQFLQVSVQYIFRRIWQYLVQIQKIIEQYIKMTHKLQKNIQNRQARQSIIGNNKFYPLPQKVRSNRSVILSDISGISNILLNQTRQSDFMHTNMKQSFCSSDDHNTFKKELSLCSTFQHSTHSPIPFLDFGNNDEVQEQIQNSNIDGSQNQITEIGDASQYNVNIVTLPQKFMLNKIDRMQRQLERLQKEYPLLQKENQRLKEEGLLLRKNHEKYKNKIKKLQKCVQEKDNEITKRSVSNYKDQIKLINSYQSNVKYTFQK